MCDFFFFLQSSVYLAQVNFEFVTKKMKSLQLATILVAICIVNNSIATKLDEKFSWKSIDYDWPTPLAREQAISKEQFIPENNMPLGLDVWKDKLFITVPRFKPGVVSSLNYVNISSAEKSPLLMPYPNLKANTIDINSDGFLVDNASLASVFRVRVDECDRLWVMDTGFVDYLGLLAKYPTLYIYDLKTDQIIKQHSIQLSDLRSGSYFINVIVDIPKNDCDNAFAYLPDLKSGIMVYSYKSDESWRVDHSFFHFDPLYTDYNVGGVNFQWQSGIFGMAVGNPNKMGVRTVYFHALSSSREFAVPNNVLQNKTRASSTEIFHDFSLIGDRGAKGQSTAEFLHEESNVLFYAQVQKDAIYCWNANQPYVENTQGLVDKNSETLVFSNDLKVDRNGYLWVLSDRIPTFIFSKFNPDEYNFRILRGNVSELIAGTPCGDQMWSPDFAFPTHE